MKVISKKLKLLKPRNTNNFRVSKKADVQISMSWVFMLIIGVLFLVLAYNIIGKYKQIEEEKFDLEVKNALRTVMNNVGRSLGVEGSKIEPMGNLFRDSKVEILCEDGMSIFSINGNLDANNQYLNSYPVFMTYIEQAEVDFTYMVVESFKMPFKTTSMLALVSKRNLIVFDENSNMAKKLVTKFNKGAYDEIVYIGKDFRSDLPGFIDSLKSNNYNSIMFVSDDGTDLTGINLKDIDFQAYHLTFDNIYNTFGNLTYFDQNDNTYTFNYIDYDESLTIPTMAVFSSPETFKCSHKKIIDNSISAYNFYINKTSYLMNISLDSNIEGKICSIDLSNIEQSYFYESLKNSLSSMSEELKTERFNNTENLISILREIEDSQKILESYNCAYVY